MTDMAKVGYTQTDRALRLDSPLGPDVLLLRGFSGTESISQLFRFHLDLLSEDDSLALEALVGKPVTVHVEKLDGKVCWHGFISRFSQGAQTNRVTHYRAEMVPWLWFLTRTADCRIFQNKTVPEIIQRIFKDLGFTDFALRLHGSFRAWEYCVQYRESDFNFVSRLMEEEGIYYFFEQAPDGSKHTLVLANSDAAHKPCPGQAKARCEMGSGGTSLEDVITDWQLEHELRPSAWAHTDYNFQTPSTNLMVNLQEKAGYEIYDFPGSYEKRADGDALAKARLQETRAFQNRSAGSSRCRSFGAGYTVEVLEHYRGDVNKKYLFTSVTHQASMGTAYTSGDGDAEFYYENHFEAIPASVPFRAPRTTPKPVVQGCQSAVVVGPAGEEIYTDKFGRVKVQFHWDREGKRDENSSCWIRVSHPWAGRNWGAIHIPRIGQEVLVDFLEGDPDQPVIIGRVYHAENMPPWALPGKAVISGFKSDSTKGGGGYNEFSMDDTKGNELIQVHAQFDQDIKVEHDERTWVGHDRTETVDHDERIRIGNDKTEVVNRDRTLQVDRDKSETVVRNKVVQIGGNQSENIDGAMSIVVGKTLTESVLINLAQTVGGAMEISVGGAIAITAGGVLAETVGGIKTETVGGNKAETIGGGKSLTIAKDLTETVNGSRNVKIQKDISEEVSGKHREEITKEFELAAKKVQITAEDEIHLKTGSAEIILKKNGNITIKGSKINVEGSGDVIIKGSKVKAN